MTSVTRSSVIDCRKSFSRPAGVEIGASSLRARVRESAIDGGPEGLLLELAVAAELGTSDYLAAVAATSADTDLSPYDAELAALVGRPVRGGFRAALAGLQVTREGRILRRILWDFPISSMVAGQPTLLDHPQARLDPVMDLSGTDQCSGWRAGGEMMLTIERMEGRLRMPLGPLVERGGGPLDVTAGWGDDLAAVTPMASRRARRTTVTSDAQGLRAVVAFRDSYADPDGVERALHEWTVTAGLDPDSGRIETIEVDSGRLPWQECPSSGASAQRLVGRRPEEIDALAAKELRGISTCTHLNDTLRSMAELPDLIGRLNPGGTSPG